MDREGTSRLALNENSLKHLVNDLYIVRKKWKWIGLGLGVKSSELDAMCGSLLECLYSMLSEWVKGVDPGPSWEELVAVLRSPTVDETGLAKELEETFCPTTSTALSRNPIISSVSAGRSTRTPLPLPSPEDDRHDSDEYDLFASSHFRPSLRNALSKITHPEVRRKLNQKQNQFRTLVKKTQKHLDRTIHTKEELDAFKVAITLLPASLDGQQVLLSPDDRKEICSATDTAQVIIVLNQYWTFVQYELLEYVVHEYGSNSLIMEMRAYVDHMDKLEADIGISHVHAVQLCFPQLSSVVMRVHLQGSDHTLRDPRQAQRATAEQCQLHPHAVRTYQGLPGSVILTLIIPFSVMYQVLASLHGLAPAGDLLSRPLEERVIYTMSEVETGMLMKSSTKAVQLLPAAGKLTRPHLEAERLKKLSSSAPPPQPSPSAMSRSHSTPSASPADPGKIGDLATKNSPSRTDTAGLGFGAHDLVKVDKSPKPWYGVIMYKGEIDGCPGTFAGVEMEEAVEGGHSGKFNGRRYFTCEDGHGLILPLSRLQPDDRFGPPPALKGGPSATGADVERDRESTPAASLSSPATPHKMSDPFPPDLTKDVAEMSLEEATGNDHDNDFGTFVFECPGDVTGFVIGKGGKNLRHLESKTNTVIKVDKNEHDLAANATVVIAGTRENRREALVLILQNIHRKRALHTSTTETMEIPNQHVGRVIGKKGANVKAIQNLTGTRIDIHSLKGMEAILNPEGLAKCEITGSATQIEKAKEMIKLSVEGGDIAGAAYMAAFMFKFMTELKESVEYSS